jgi:type IV pilus assembly protein PilM
LARGDFESTEEQQQAQKVLTTVSEILALEIHKTLDYFKTLSSTFDIETLYVSGGGSHVPGLLEHCREKLQLPIELFDPFRAVKRLPSGVSRDYLQTVAPDLAIAVGLALRSTHEA